MTRHRYTGRTLAREVAVLLAAAVFCVPLYLVVTISFKSDKELLENPFGVPQAPTLEPYMRAWTEAGQSGMAVALVSSLVIAVGTIVLVIVVGSTAAYAIGRRGGRIGTLLYVLFLLGFIVPTQLAIVPLYAVFSTLGLLGNLVSMILLEAGFMMPLGVILYTGFVRMLPRDYEEAARLDGASEWAAFRRVVLPLLKPVTGTVAVMCAILTWNDFFAPLIFLSGSDFETLPVAVYSFVGEFASEWTTIFAAIVISILPVLVFYIAAQKQLMEGFSGGIKG